MPELKEIIIKNRNNKNTAVIFENNSYSYSEITEKALILSEIIKKVVEKRVNIGILLPNSLLYPGAFISPREKSKESKPPNPLAVTGRCISPKAVPASYTNSKSNRPATSDTRKGFGWTLVSSLRTSMARISACMRQRESARRCRQNTV